MTTDFIAVSLREGFVLVVACKSYLALVARSKEIVFHASGLAPFPIIIYLGSSL